MTEHETPSTGRYQVIKSEGARCWYVQEVATCELVTVTFRTKKAAAEACARRNLPAELKNQPLRAQLQLVEASARLDSMTPPTDSPVSERTQPCPATPCTPSPL